MYLFYNKYSLFMVYNSSAHYMTYGAFSEFGLSEPSKVLWLAISWWVDHHIDDTGHICHLKQQHSWSILSHSDMLNLKWVRHFIICEWHDFSQVFSLSIVTKRATHLILNLVVCSLRCGFHINHLQRKI